MRRWAARTGVLLACASMSAVATVGVLDRAAPGGVAAAAAATPATTSAPPTSAASSSPAPSPSPAGAPPQDPDAGGAGRDTLLFVVAPDEGSATSVTLLAGGGATSGRVVFVPTNTLVRIPGFGTERIGLAHRIGGADLVLASLENALGIEIDGVARTTPERLGDVLAPADAPVVDGGGAGADPAELAASWTRPEGGDGLTTSERQQRAWEAVFAAAAANPAAAGAIAGALPQLTPEGRTGAAALLADLATAADEGSLVYGLLPVRSAGTADDGPTYRLHSSDAETFVASALPGSRPGDHGSLRVQVLNGVGVPGVARAVDERLDGESVRVVLSDNAREFGVETTRVVVYDDRAEVRRAAEQVRARLGVGTIERSRQPQSMVDLTIMVGADFVP